MAEPASTGKEPSSTGSRSSISRLLSRVDRQASRQLPAVLVVSAAGVWICVSVVVGFAPRWETVFQTVVAALTLAMVFVIQHTQARHQRATQRKLDEILRALPGANNSLLTLEHAADSELHVTGQEHRQIRQAALEDDPAAGSHELPRDTRRLGRCWRVAGRCPSRGVTQTGRFRVHCLPAPGWV
jgi:low affinity Fe/Cu permease